MHCCVLCSPFESGDTIRIRVTGRCCYIKEQEMEGKVTFSVLTENHEGPIGEDWRYWIEAKVFNRGLQGRGTIKVEKH